MSLVKSKELLPGSPDTQYVTGLTLSVTVYNPTRNFTSDIDTKDLKIGNNNILINDTRIINAFDNATYGNMFTTSDQTNRALEDIQLLAKEFTKYGVAVTDTIKMAADAAAMGKTGAELTAQVAEATRLAVLGGVEQEKAL